MMELPDLLRPAGDPFAELGAALLDFGKSPRERWESLRARLSDGTITMETARIHLRHLYQDLPEPRA